MSDNLSTKEIYKIYNNKNDEPTSQFNQFTPISKKRKAPESPTDTERQNLRISAAKGNKQRLNKKINDKVIQDAANPMVSILLNGVLTDIDDIKVPEL